ncbi:AAA family ATPase [Saccharothrix sp. HUAS TT1]|uniref:AAA family ATPase n=1 Tax=unclassified Saccharothrix TaxID=2593673 RepID=UPI00345B973A
MEIGTTRDPGSAFGPGAAPRWASHAPGLLVDRDDEVEQLRHRVADLARRGRSGMVTVTGHRGTGLSAMVALVVAEARAVGLRVATARGVPAESDLAFGVVRQLVASVTESAPTTIGATLRGTTGLAACQVEETAIPALCADFLAMAREHPLVVALDDAQWTDGPSWRWLRAMARRLGQAPLLLVRAGTHTLDTPGCPDWRPEPDHPGARVMRLRPLREPGVREVISARYPGPVDGSFVAEAHSATGGSPAVLHEVLSRLARAQLPPAAEQVPQLAASAAAVLGDRAADAVSTLPPDALTLLRALVLCGDALGFELTCALAAPRHVPAATAAALLHQVGLITGDDELRPAGPEVRAGALAGLPADERDRLLREAVAIGRRAAIPDDRLAALLVAAPPVDAEWAAALLVRVAARRREAGDHAAAAALLAAALREPMSAERRLGLLVDLGALEVVDNPRAADRRLRQALLETAPDGPTAVLAADLLHAHGDAPTARRVIATVRARGEADGADTAALAAIGWLADNDCTPDALHPARAFPDPPTDSPDVGEPVGAGVAAWALTLRGEHRARARALARCALAARDDDRPAPFGHRLHACRALLHADDIASAVVGLDAVVADARRRGVPAVAAVALLHRGWCELRRGNLAQAEDDLARARGHLPADSWHPRVAPAVTALAGMVLLARHEVDDAARATTAAPPAEADRGAAWGLLQCVRGEVALALGDPTTALRRFDRCGRVLLARGWVNPALAAWRSLAATAHATLGNRDTARALTSDAVERAVRWGAPSTLAQVSLWAFRVNQRGGTTTPDTTPPGPPAPDHGTTAPNAADPNAADHSIAAPDAADLNAGDHSIADPNAADHSIAVLAGAGRSAAEIAGLLDVPVHAVRRRLSTFPAHPRAPRR